MKIITPSEHSIHAGCSTRSSPAPPEKINHPRNSKSRTIPVKMLTMMVYAPQITQEMMNTASINGHRAEAIP